MRFMIQDAKLALLPSLAGIVRMSLAQLNKESQLEWVSGCNDAERNKPERWPAQAVRADLGMCFIRLLSEGAQRKGPP